MLWSACAAAAEFAHGGDHLVIDEMLLTPDLLPMWLDALAGLDVQLVSVTCPLAVAEQRELARGNEIGLARGYLRPARRSPCTVASFLPQAVEGQ
ncbi:chloramphenicol phosphotransferase CPT family protein [Nocardia vinacea]|uniref:Chloramphenicol phosphotransferase CPT family protein n=1 Tax=Nocardia vinacea TaxID=96468 RepID=A0ABZ1YMY4_9NOCA|nr:chloramphenicol phosphotransferase CPT family protein [Nocardia vinacea]